MGVVGAGNISGQYLDNLVKFPLLDVRFIADNGSGRAAQQARRFDIRRSGTTSELLDDSEIDIVVLLSPPRHHLPLGLAVLGAGKHLYCEKPLAPTLAEARQLLDAGAASGLRVACAPDTFLGPGARRVHRMIRDGAIGRTVFALSTHQDPGPDRWHPDPEFLFQTGAGPLLDIGPYHVTTLVQLLGRVDRVSAVATTGRREREIQAGPRRGSRFGVDVPTSVGMLLTFASGAEAQSVLTFDSGVSRRSLELIGTEGSISAVDPDVFDAEVVLHSAGGSRQVFAATSSPQQRGLGVAELAEALQGRRRECASGELAFHVLDVLESAAHSARTHVVTDVKSDPEVSALPGESWDPRVVA